MIIQEEDSSIRMSARYIAIEGNIGSGKTTLAQLLGRVLEAELVLEQFADNTFLPKFYSNPARFAFPLELSFLVGRYKQLKEQLSSGNKFGNRVVADYLFVKTRLFASINLEQAEYELFAKVQRAMELQLPQPDVLIYLHAPITTLQKRIRQRGRAYETGLSDDYLARISNMYDEYLNTIDIPVIMVDTTAHDFREDGISINALKHLLDNNLQTKRYYLGTNTA
jgi:deoxyadenosine/deoxycytidine kinase